jgi:hypothetical protein
MGPIWTSVELKIERTRPISGPCPRSTAPLEDQRRLIVACDMLLALEADELALHRSDEHRRLRHRHSTWTWQIDYLIDDPRRPIYESQLRRIGRHGILDHQRLSRRRSPP